MDSSLSSLKERVWYRHVHCPGLCWRQDLVASNQIAASFHVINKPCATPRLTIRDTLVHPSRARHGRRARRLGRKSCSIASVTEPKRRTEASCKGLRLRDGCESIYERAPRVPHCGPIIAHTAGTTLRTRCP